MQILNDGWAAQETGPSSAPWGTHGTRAWLGATSQRVHHALTARSRTDDQTWSLDEGRG